ncbi:hypothetical protein SMD20_12770 [Nonomuraea sp. LP-02]|uniref:hypothetical protein n=1 Tax=Nonomuraea sp. LP-02 TaxID=3097960 RepID=UPI002E3063C3|nr:hypothetical protein [Nonomuraea sp. LP-02]MED7925118.1 hypothetical protein [Nonomuraea sp. LP-02]
MEIHKKHLRSAADAYDLERESLGEFVRDAAGELNAIGAFWGDDKLGTTFAKGQGGAGGYEAVTGQVMAGVVVWLDAHHEIAERLRLMADVVQVADWATIAQILAELPQADPGRPIWGTG